MEHQTEIPNESIDTSSHEPVNTFGASRAPKTRITLTFTVTNPVEETNKWQAQGIFAPAARAISFMGGQDITLEGIEFQDINDDNG